MRNQTLSMNLERVYHKSSTRPMLKDISHSTTVLQRWYEEKEELAVSLNG